ncbi:MGMT family protein [Nocardia terpenica]|uniref:Methylated-DNA-[protein]-cysteine S-methyltransferase DNA binding domain-containing protein n=1 Tax=Nocardia terpenica TaxID=455432 RepID=A0A164KPB9_9NOCA|nr:MGMT family protein [Nocardia terpenica]KZM71592.1 hypothetical protein AWN90_02340 [Nocardia terpenica]
MWRRCWTPRPRRRRCRRRWRPGRVSTYGDIAAAAGLSTPRTVGWIMRTDSADLPWHRVLRADGTPAPHLRHRQLQRLAEEGCPVLGDRVDIRPP